MIVVARAVKGKEFWYNAQSAHRVNPKKACAICDALNKCGYALNDGEVWHTFDVGMYDNAYAYGEMQGFQMRKDGTIRKVGRV